MSVSHVGHVELRVPDVAQSVEFLTKFVGLRLTAEENGSAYLRAWQDFDHHTLQLTEAREGELGHIAWRVPDKSGVLAIEDELKSRDIESVWIEGSSQDGHGDALRFFTPGGMPFELYWEVEPYRAPEGERSRFPSHPIRLSLQGPATRRLDHVGVNVDDVAAEQEFVTDVLGIHHRYYGTAPDNVRQFSWVSRTSVSHEMSMVRNGAGTGALFHHLAYFVESTEDLLRTATVLVDNGYELDWGPGRHGTSGATALYFKEPGGHRIEIWTGGLLIFAPDWQAIEWKGEVLYAVADIWGNAGLTEKFLTGTPVASELADAVRS
jgi:catechol 2,3-dioxygenase